MHGEEGEGEEDEEDGEPGQPFWHVDRGPLTTAQRNKRARQKVRVLRRVSGPEGKGVEKGERERAGAGAGASRSGSESRSRSRSWRPRVPED